MPPHVEIAAQVHADSIRALHEGTFTLTVAPARAVGTLTGRFTTITPDSDLTAVYAAIPTLTPDALPVQLSVPPAYTHAQNVCRVPPYLPHILALGEHRRPDEPGTVIRVDDLAITATGDGLHLVSRSRGQVLELQAFHALALDKQPPPLARFLIHLTRALLPAWHEFDWGPHAHQFAYLPRVRYRRTILSPARWRLNATDIAADPSDLVDPSKTAGPREASSQVWRRGLREWTRGWRCPDAVLLRDADRTLPLRLSEPAHAAILRAHLDRHGHALLIETRLTREGLGWIGGHAHQVVVPLLATRRSAPPQLHRHLPELRNHSHGQLPGSITDSPEPGDGGWLYAKIHTHPDRMDDVLTRCLPGLLHVLADPPWWFIRYRSRHEGDHIRLRLHLGTAPDVDPDEQLELPGRWIRDIGVWAAQLRAAGLAGRLSFETYEPEVGRYGTGAALRAAEAVFAADSRAVTAQLRLLPPSFIDRRTLGALNMVATASGFLVHPEDAMRWLTNRAAPGPPVDRRLLSEVVARVRAGHGDGLLSGVPGWDEEIGPAWAARTEALHSYQALLPEDVDRDGVLDSLLHMSHNRVRGVDPDGEAACRRLARHAALAHISSGGHR
jgi:class I lanthipeptide synthase